MYAYSVIVQDNNKFLNIPYLPASSAYIFPLNSINGCKGVMVVGKDSLENHIGLFSFIANHNLILLEDDSNSIPTSNSSIKLNINNTIL